MLKNYKQAIILLEKALTYAWANSFPEEEIQMYDIMGLCYFYEGEIEKADFYHSKWADGSIEPSSSYYRRTSKDFISMYERTLPTPVTQFKSMLSGYLSLPFQNLSDSNRNKFDNNKIVKYSNCQSQKLLDEILNGLEFTEFHMEHHESAVIKPRQFKRATLPRRIREISQKYQKNEDKYRFTHQIYENPLYRISLQQFVDFRRKQSFPLERVEQTIKKNMASLVEPFKKSAQIYVKHTQQTYKENNGQFLVKNQNLLLKLLDL